MIRECKAPVFSGTGGGLAGLLVWIALLIAYIMVIIALIIILPFAILFGFGAAILCRIKQYSFIITHLMSGNQNPNINL